MKRHLIIGNGGAAVSAVRAIRSVAAEDEITLVSQEDGPAYSPMLTPYYLAGRLPRRGLLICDQGFYRQHRVKALLGRRATGVDPRAGTVLLEDGSALPFDSLLIATGASAVRLTMSGMDLPGVFCLRTLADAQGILRASKRARKVLFIGGGLVSLEVAQALFREGLGMTFVVGSGHVLSQNVDAPCAAMVQARLEQHGVSFLLGDDLVSLEKEGRKLRAVTNQSKELEADMVVVGRGVRPNVDLVRGSGVKMNNGIVVDETLRASVEGIYAAGDVAEGMDIATGRPHVNATWPNAIGQGWTAGLNMAGKKTPYLRNVRVNICTLFGLSFASVGAVRGDGEGHQVLASRVGGSYRKLVFQGDILIGALLAGDVADAGILANRVEQRKPSLDLRRAGPRSTAFLPFARNLVVIGKEVRYGRAGL